MSCSHDDRLLDLVLGELPAAEAAQLRAAALDCPHCQGELAKLELGAALASRMPLEEPPPSMDGVILAAAAEKATTMAAQQHEVAATMAPAIAGPVDAETSAESEGLWGKVRGWMAGITLGPQLAMASVMVLVVSIGLWYLPDTGPERTARTRVTPDPEGEAISALPTLEPPDETDRFQDDPAVALRFGEKEPASEAPPGDSAGRVRARESARPGASSRFRSDEGLGGLSREAAAEAPSAAPAPEAPTRQARSAARSEAERAPVVAGSPLPSYGSNAGTEGAPSGAAGGSAYEQGVGSYRGGNYRDAEDELLQAVGEAQPDREHVANAVHQLARSYRRQGQCGQAVTQYENLFSNHPSYAQIPQALIESADCHRQLNRLRDARQLLERARRFASTQAAASRELVRIETLERATRRRAPSPASADSVDAPAGF